MLRSNSQSSSAASEVKANRVLRSLTRLLVAFVLLETASGAHAQTLATRSEKIGDGTVVYNVIGAGPTVLLIHGLFADKEQWSALAPLIANGGYAALSVDLPGYGKSSGFSLTDFALEREVEHLHALIARLGIARIHIAGNSMGGAIAALYSQRYPREVRSLAFLGSPLGITTWAEAFKAAVSRGINPFIPINEAELDTELELLFVNPPAISEQEKRAIVANYVARERHYVQVWNIVNLYDDVLTRIRPTRAPTLIVWGDDDRVFSAVGARKLRDRIPGSTVRKLPRAGHLLHLENAAEVAPLYLSFLKVATRVTDIGPDTTARAPSRAASHSVRARFVCAEAKTVEAVFTNAGHPLCEAFIVRRPQSLPVASEIGFGRALRK